MTKFFEETTFSFVDIETDGMSAQDNHIIDIAIVQYKGHKEINRFETLINHHEDYIPWFIQNMTGITPEMLVGKPSFREVAEEISNILEDTVFVAHNVSFDYGFVSHKLKTLSLSTKMKRLCTVKLSRKVNKSLKSHSLDSIIQLLELKVENRHRALDDTLVVVEFYKYLHTKFSEDELESILKTFIH